jgi:hypothetical protein
LASTRRNISKAFAADLAIGRPQRTVTPEPPIRRINWLIMSFNKLNTPGRQE